MVLNITMKFNTKYYFSSNRKCCENGWRKPVLVDVNPKNILIDEKSLLNKNFKEKTKFIIPVHIRRGNNINKIVDIKENQLRL